jgi:hypothetical protein
MSFPKNHENRRHQFWCAVVVVLAVCSLTVSVTTRYCSPGGSISVATTLHNFASIEHGRQRLLKYAPLWGPPVVRCAMFGGPISSPHLAPASPPILDAICDKCLYNRPPPASELLS